MIKREIYMERIRPFMGQEIVKVLTGIRRCGKSVMLKLIRDELISGGVDEEQILEINFETRAVDYVKNVEETYNFIKKTAKKNQRKTYLFLDEIQELEQWEKMINSCMIDMDVDIYITGSNAYMMSGELATYLGGRYVEFKIYPFSSKICLVDHGIREAVYGNNMRDINQTLENIVYMELLRRGYTVRIGKAGEKEVDFVAYIGGDKLYIQVSYLLADEATMEHQ